MKTVTCGMIVRCYLMLAMVLSALAVHGQNKTVINIGEGSGSGSAAGQDSIKIAIIQHRESDGVDYPNTPDTVAWKAKLINTEVVDEIGVTIIGDTTLSIPEGKYLISYTAVGGLGGNIRLYNISGSSVLSQAIHRQEGTVTGTAYISSAMSIQVQYYLPYSFPGWSANVLGLAHESPDAYEVYTEITIIKLQ